MFIASLKRARPRALMVMLSLAASAFMWPGLLQIEKLPARAEHLAVLGPADDSGGGLAASPRPVRHRTRLPHLNVPAPSFGALREGPTGPPFAQLSSLTPALLANPDLLKPVSFTPQAPTAPPADPFVLPGPRPSPDDFVGGPGPAGPNRPGNPPITNPNDPGPPVVNPPVDPGAPPVTPPVVTPPDGPPPLTHPNPPVIDPTSPFTPDDPVDGGPGGGGPPPSGAPEPGVWLELILGAGLAGIALRRARLQPATALRAVSRA
jgi:hypothetical protein